MHKYMKSPHFAPSIDLLPSFSVRIIYLLSIGSPANGAAICRTQEVERGVDHDEHLEVPLLNRVGCFSMGYNDLLLASLQWLTYMVYDWLETSL